VVICPLDLAAGVTKYGLAVRRASGLDGLYTIPIILSAGDFIQFHWTGAG
jgi:hypothetical protein